MASKKKLDLTKEEVSRFEKAFQDPEFRKLFGEYAQELANDPKGKEISKIEKDLLTEIQQQQTKKESRVEEIIEDAPPPVVTAKPNCNITHKIAPTNHLLIEIELPLLTSIAGIDLEVSRKMLSLKHDKKLYALEVFLPFEVDDDSTKAQFNKTTHILSVQLEIREGS